MNRTYIVLIVIAVLGAIGFVVFALNQNIAKPYIMSTTANEPTLPLGSQMMSSSLWDYENGDFIIFLAEDYFSKEKLPHIFRLVASEGDTLEIKKGIVYVNSTNVDENYTLKHLYKIHFDDYPIFEDNIHSGDYVYPSNQAKTDSLLVHLPDAIAIKDKTRRVITSNTIHNSAIEETYNALWNKDKFGPLIIPEQKLFVMGDNRDNSQDSRFIGLVDNKDVLGTIKLSK
tara:strand:- start:206630 stop:207316 length:687 start_codon:yes stop_codon:yes gene_type:complete